MLSLVDLAERSPTLRKMLDQQERARRVAGMLALTSTTAAVALLEAQAERTAAVLPQIKEELYPVLTPQRFDLACVADRRGRSDDNALRALARRVERLERAADKSMNRRV